VTEREPWLAPGTFLSNQERETAMSTMKAIVITKYGDPDVLRIQELPIPRVTDDTVVVRVRAFGLNHAEAYFRKGAWGDVAKVTGIECAGEVHDPGKSGLATAQRVFALMGGMGRTINGSYAEYVRVPSTNVVPVRSNLDWETLAAIPESYATAWTILHHNLDVRPGQRLVVRGGTSALGQAAIQIGRELGLQVHATSRTRDKSRIVESLGAAPLLESPALSSTLRKLVPGGVDAVLDIVGTSTLLDSFKMVRYRGRVAQAGFLGGADPLAIDPMTQMPSGVQYSFFASAFVFGGPDLPLSDIPFGDIVERGERGAYRVEPAHVFDFGDIVLAHQLMESGNARGKIVVRAP
jgi:NADPH:quinone reductase-like Zn-dependent oxidoreductase